MKCWGLTTLAEADSARSIALEVISRLEVPRAQQGEQHLEPSLAGGAAGLAVLLGYLDRCSPADGWDKAAHAAVLRMSQSLAVAPTPPIGLFGGLAGAAFALWYLSHDDTRYRRARATVEDIVLPQATALATSFPQRRGMPSRITTWYPAYAELRPTFYAVPMMTAPCRRFQSSSKRLWR